MSRKVEPSMVEGFKFWMIMGARVVIERVKGKASGDVTLYFEDGTRAGEKELASLLHSYSRADFEAIFSFSLFNYKVLKK